MTYSDKAMDHFLNPRNTGSLDEKDTNVGTGMVGSPQCGDVMRLQLKIGKGNVIEDAKFKTFGCGAAIASSSLAVEWVKGKTIAEALKLTNSRIAKELSLPLLKVHCSVLAEDALRAALTDYLKKNNKEIAVEGTENN